MTQEKDWGAIARRLSDEKRTAILLMGENTDTLDGFEIPYGVMKELIMQELVNYDAEDDVADMRPDYQLPKRTTYWLNRNGLTCYNHIVAQNIAANKAKE